MLRSIQSTLFVAARYPQARKKNKQIQTLNNWLAEFALKNAIEFLNINLLASKNVFLRDDLTYDGTHLNAQGNALRAPEGSGETQTVKLFNEQNPNPID